MKLDVRSILKTAALGGVVSLALSLVFWAVSTGWFETVVNSILGGFIGFLFGWISMRNDGDDSFSALALGGGLSAVLPVALAWVTSMNTIRPEGMVEGVPIGTSLFLGILLGGAAGLIMGVIGGLIYGARY